MVECYRCCGTYPVCVENEHEATCCIEGLVDEDEYSVGEDKK
jgi:hypothetical protein